MFIQQGDVILTKIETLPSGMISTDFGNVIHKGLNHVHSISGEFKLYNDGEFLEVLSESVLGHPEHGKSDEVFRKVPVGFYKKSIVQVYDHFLEEAREVQD